MLSDPCAGQEQARSFGQGANVALTASTVATLGELHNSAAPLFEIRPLLLTASICCSEAVCCGCRACSSSSSSRSTAYRKRVCIDRAYVP
jgi:hypothetical protein